MKAFFTKAPMQFELREVELQPPAPDEVVVQIKACGVCGWDVLTAQVVAEDWLGFGHECSGVVVQTGSAVPNVKVGDRVIVENSTFCGVCEQCKRGNVVHCSNMDHYRSPGAFAELLKVRCTSVFPIGDLDFPAAALAEPLTVAIDMVESADIPLCGRVAVFGPGPIGLMICRLAQVKGASRVYLTGKRHSHRRWQVAEQLGITQAVYVDEGSAVDQIRRLEPQGLDRVLVTTPPNTIAEAVELCRFGGIIAYDGIKFGEAGKISLDGNKFHFNRLQLRGVHSVPNLGWVQALDLLRRKVIDPALFISQTFRFDQVPEAVRFAAEQRDRVVKVMVEF